MEPEPHERARPGGPSGPDEPRDKWPPSVFGPLVLRPSKRVLAPKPVLTRKQRVDQTLATFAMIATGYATAHAIFVLPFTLLPRGMCSAANCDPKQFTKFLLITAALGIPTLVWTGLLLLHTKRAAMIGLGGGTLTLVAYLLAVRVA